MKPVFLALFIALLFTVAPFAWQAPSAPEPDPGLRTRLNEGRIGIMSGRVQGTYVRLAADLATVLESTGVRVVPMVGRGSIQAVEDLMGLDGVDLAMFQSDVLNLYYRHNAPMAALTDKMRYVTLLYAEELHLLARADIGSVWDLEGKVVNVGPQASGTFLTSLFVFADLGINIKAQTDPHHLALEKLRRGEIAAMSRIVGQPSASFREISPESGLRFVALPTGNIAAPYQPARLTKESYPNLISEPIDTISTTALLAAYSRSDDPEQTVRINRFVKAFFANFERLRGDGYHPKWREVDLAAAVPGWKRLPAAERALLEIGLSAGDASGQITSTSKPLH